MTALALGRFVRGTRGGSPLQAVVLLAVALFILIGLRAAAGRAARATAGAVAAETGSADGASGAPAALPPSTLSRPALGPEAAEAQRRLDDIPDLGLVHEVAKVAGYRPGSDEYKAFEKKYGAAWNILPFYDPGTGTVGVVLTAKDPNNKQVHVGVGGTNPTDLRHWGVNFGQHFEDMTAGEAFAEVGWALLRRQPLEALSVPFGYLLSTLGRGEGDGVALIAARLAERYGAENVTATGNSKGGRAAAFMAAMTGIRAVTFNAARLSNASLDIVRERGVENPERYITNIATEGEILGRIERYGRAPPRLGSEITVGGEGSAVGRHMVDGPQLNRPVRYRPAKPLAPR